MVLGPGGGNQGRCVNRSCKSLRVPLNYYHGIYYIVLDTDLSYYYTFESHIGTIFNTAVNADQTR